MSAKIKMYCIFAKDSVVKMNGNRGKLAAMAGHAFLHAAWDAMYRPEATKADEHIRQQLMDYRDSDHAYKIALVVDRVADLEILEKAYRSQCGVSLVRDAGFTVFDGPTVVCLGIGPISEDRIGDDIKALKLFL